MRTHGRGSGGTTAVETYRGIIVMVGCSGCRSSLFIRWKIITIAKRVDTEAVGKREAENAVEARPHTTSSRLDGRCRSLGLNRGFPCVAGSNNRQKWFMASFAPLT